MTQLLVQQASLLADQQMQKFPCLSRCRTRAFTCSATMKALSVAYTRSGALGL